VEFDCLLFDRFEVIAKKVNRKVMGRIKVVGPDILRETVLSGFAAATRTKGA